MRFTSYTTPRSLTAASIATSTSDLTSTSSDDAPREDASHIRDELIVIHQVSMVRRPPISVTACFENATNVTMGDGHANVGKVMAFLLSVGAIDLPDDALLALFTHYREISIDAHHAVVNRLFHDCLMYVPTLTKEKASMLQGLLYHLSEFNINRIPPDDKAFFRHCNTCIAEYHTLQAVIAPFHLVEAIKYIEQIQVINPKLIVRLLGDLLADRHGHDYLMLSLIAALSEKGLVLRIIYSNHDAVFFHAWALRGICEGQLIERRMGFPHTRSLTALNKLLVAGRINEDDLNTLVVQYKRCLQLLDYSLTDDGGITVYTHALSDLENLANTSAQLDVPFYCETRYELAQTINLMNLTFQAHLMEDDLYKLDGSQDPGDSAVTTPLEDMIWNRDHTKLNDRTRTTLADGSPVRFSHGHSHTPTPHGEITSYTEEVLNLDNYNGKTARAGLEPDPHPLLAVRSNGHPLSFAQDIQATCSIARRILADSEKTLTSVGISFDRMHESHATISRVLAESEHTLMRSARMLALSEAHMAERIRTVAGVDTHVAAVSRLVAQHSSVFASATASDVIQEIGPADPPSGHLLDIRAHRG